MASLTTAARTARTDATRLRSEAQELKLVTRGNLARSRKRLGQAQLQADRARERCAVPCASPWSGLEWVREDELLGRVLVPVD